MMRRTSSKRLSTREEIIILAVIQYDNNIMMYCYNSSASCGVKNGNRFPIIEIKKKTLNEMLLLRKKSEKTTKKTPERRTCTWNDKLRARRVADELERGKDV